MPFGFATRVSSVANLICLIRIRSTYVGELAMRDRILRPLNKWRAEFARCSEGSIVPAFAVLAIPFMAMVGASIDYSRASSVRGQLQASLDAAVLAGAKDA